MNNMKRMAYLGSLALLCAALLMAQIAFSRLLSIIHFYHLAFFSISMAMLGLTGGAILLYQLERRYGRLDLAVWLPRACRLFGFSMPIALLAVLFTTVSSPAQILPLVAGMLLPYLAAGVAVALALTRSPYPVGLTYGADLLGASAGCLIALVLLDMLLPVEAILAIAACGLLAAGCFSYALRHKPDRLAVLGLVILAGLSWLQTTSYGLPIRAQKNGEFYATEYAQSNSYSHITLSKEVERNFFYWGASADAKLDPTPQRMLLIDELAGTPMYNYAQLGAKADYLKYDVTNLAYSIRHNGKAAVIGVGGGRDILSARHFGFTDITGVELNSINVGLLTKQPYASYAGIGLDPAVKIHVDDGRSWFARTTEKFDLIQMSMVDTWAATGAGNFTLSENGLYTVQGWHRFIAALTDNGVLTVSRWYSPNRLDETARMISLGIATLSEFGVTAPRQHIYVAGVSNLATLILSRAPLSSADLDRLDSEAAARGYHVIASPRQPSPNETIEKILNTHDVAGILAITRDYPINLSPTYDDSPFFFNQLKMKVFLQSTPGQYAAGVISGNLVATITLLIIIMISAVMIMPLLILPALSSLSGISRRLGLFGSGYFLLIGLGFMFIEIGIIQRMSIFLGHPIYGLAIVLFSLILATGIGSMISDRLHPTPRLLVLWLSSLIGFIALIAFKGQVLTAHYESASLGVRAMVAILHIFPAAILMGFAFPLGLRLSMQVDQRPAPWFWGINGAAGVLASGIAVLISMSSSITMTLLTGAACYALLLGPALGLLRLQQSRSQG